MINHKQNKLKFLVFFLFISIFITPSVFASTSDGTIDSTYKYAWGENVGFIDFSSTAGNVHITDSALSGSAYGENIGWINLSTVTNNNEGTLGGYAWGENVGFIDFSKVIIGNDGVFSGSAYGENIGWITFGTTNNKVQTDWRPLSSRSTPTPTSSHSSSGSMPGSTPIVTIPTTSSLTTTPCLNGALYNTTTGLLCATTPNPLDGQATITRNLKLTIPRMSGTDVKDLQTYLNTHNYNCGIADGVFGKLTKQAVIKFQLANQLKGDGVVGPMTKSKLIN